MSASVSLASLTDGEHEFLHIGERVDHKIQLLLPHTYTAQEMPSKLYAPIGVVGRTL